MAVWHAIKGQQKYRDSSNYHPELNPPIFSAINNKTLVAENVEVDMETLRIAQSLRVHPLARHRAQEEIIEAVIKGLDTEDRKALESY